jgi:hypothetical protein
MIRNDNPGREVISGYLYDELAGEYYLKGDVMPSLRPGFKYGGDSVIVGKVGVASNDSAVESNDSAVESNDSAVESNDSAAGDATGESSAATSSPGFSADSIRSQLEEKVLVQEEDSDSDRNTNSNTNSDTNSDTPTSIAAERVPEELRSENGPGSVGWKQEEDGTLIAPTEKVNVFTDGTSESSPPVRPKPVEEAAARKVGDVA